MRRQTGQDITKLVELVHPYGKTISSLLGFSAQDPISGLLQARQLWYDCANATFRIEMHVYLADGEYAVGGIFPVTINLQATITELYHAVVALLEVEPVRISIIHAGYGQELAVPSDQPLVLANLKDNSRLVARIYYPAPAIAVNVRI
jgi:hypothetical protein